MRYGWRRVNLSCTIHKLKDHFVRHFRFAFLKLTNDALQFLDAALFEFASQQTTSAVVDRNLFDFIIIINEEREILETHIDIRVTAQTALLFQRFLTT